MLDWPRKKDQWLPAGFRGLGGRAMKRAAHIEVYKGRGAQPWRYRVVAANGEVTEQSEGYSTRGSAMRAAKKKGLRVIA